MLTCSADFLDLGAFEIDDINLSNRMQRKNGQFASLKEECSSPVENQDSSNGTPFPESM